MPYFELVLEEIFLVGKFAVEAEKTLFVGREGLVRDMFQLFCVYGGGVGTHANVNLVLLMRIHLDARVDLADFWFGLW